MHVNIATTAIVVSLVFQTLVVAQTLPDDLRALMNEPRFKQAHWGLLVVDQETKETLMEWNADKLFVPASTTKLYSVACAMEELGADYRFITRVYQAGRRDGDQLIGNLVLLASGDPSLGGRTTKEGLIAFTNNDHTYANGAPETELTAPDPLAGIRDLASQIAAKGIRRIRGDVWIDDRLFERAEGTGSGPSQLAPIMINDNVIDISIEPTRTGEPCKLTIRPATKALVIENSMRTVAAGESLETWITPLGGGKVHVHGKMPEGHKPVVRIYEVPHAASFARTLLIESLEEAGVAVDAAAVADHPAVSLPQGYDDLPVVGELVSPPFSEFAKLTLKVSHNLHASTLPLLVASKHGERTLRAGLRRQHDFLAKAGVDVDTISFGGGAGGARADYVTPRATVQLLKYVTAQPYFQAYRSALPRLGVDGTLAKSLEPDSPARDRVFAKTGTLSWENVMNGGNLLTSKALAGYLESSRGRKLLFAVFVNHVHLRGGLEARSIGKDLGKVAEIVHKSL
ncbi:MAG: D-alanyl-D-alanine carboxypeptidase precursor [Planctomycetota bacterium]